MSDCNLDDQEEDLEGSITALNENGARLQEEEAHHINELLYKILTSCILLFDLATGFLGLYALLFQDNDMCCGQEVPRDGIFLWVNISQLFLVIVEIYPVVFKYLTVLTILNPWFGMLISAALLYQSNREEALASITFELLAAGLQFYVVRFVEGRRLCCSFHLITLIPAVISILLLFSYLNDEGKCVDMMSFTGDVKFSISIEKGGIDDCALCETNGLQWNASCPANAGSTLGMTFGTYCSNETQVCWFPS